MLKRTIAIMITAVMICSLAACTSAQKSSSSTSTATAAASTSQSASSSAEAGAQTVSYSSETTSAESSSDMFTDRDLEQTADTSDAKSITVSDNQTIPQPTMGGGMGEMGKRGR